MARLSFFVTKNPAEMNEETLSKLERLTKLKEQGALTQAEYEQQKTMLIGKLPLPPRIPESKKSKWKWWHFVIIVFVVFPIIGIILEDKPTEAERKAQTTKQDSINRAEAPVRDSLVKLSADRESAYLTAKLLIKNNLNDKGSYEEVSHDTGYVGKKEIYMSSEITYRAKNGFGAMMLTTTRVDFDKRMNVIQIK